MSHQEIYGDVCYNLPRIMEFTRPPHTSAKPSRPRALLFDMDGTLVDTEALALQVFAQCAKDHGLPMDRDELHSYVGRSWAWCLSHFFAKHDVSPQIQENVRADLFPRYLEALKREVREVPGAVDFVRSAHQAGFRLALVSGSQIKQIEFVLEFFGIRELFEEVLGQEHYAESKPSPSGYLRALELMNLNPSEALVFEDSQVGVASAHNAGCLCVQVLSESKLAHPDEKAFFWIKNFLKLDIPTFLSLFKP